MTGTLQEQGPVSWWKLQTTCQEEHPIETTYWSANKGWSSYTDPEDVTGTEGGTWVRFLEQLVFQEIILRVFLVTKA